MMTTYVSSSYSLSSVMFSNILWYYHKCLDTLHSQWNNPTPLCDRNSAECHNPSYSCIALLSVTLLEQHSCYIARAAVVDQALIPLPYLHLRVNTEAMVLDSWWCRRTVFRLATFWLNRCNLSLPRASCGSCRTRFALRSIMQCSSLVYWCTIQHKWAAQRLNHGKAGERYDWLVWTITDSWISNPIQWQLQFMKHCDRNQC